MIHEKYFKLPLESDEVDPSMVFTADYDRAFDFLIENSKSKIAILEKLNGNITKSMDAHELTHKGGEIYVDGIKLLRIRSWGRLTGTGGGLGLSTEKAVEVQDSFAQWIIDTLIK
jgi:hypothetical protein